MKTMLFSVKFLVSILLCFAVGLQCLTSSCSDLKEEMKQEFAAAQKLFQEQKYDKVIDECNKIIERHPGRTDEEVCYRCLAKFMITNSYFKLENDKQAIQIASQILEELEDRKFTFIVEGTAPNFMLYCDTLDCLAAHYRNQNKLSESRQYFDKVIDMYRKEKNKAKAEGESYRFPSLIKHINGRLSAMEISAYPVLVEPVLTKLEEAHKENNLEKREKCMKELADLGTIARHGLLRTVFRDEKAKEKEYIYDAVILLFRMEKEKFQPKQFQILMDRLVKAAAGSKHDSTRIEAIKLLGQYECKDAIPTLKEAAKDDNEEIRKAAEDALKKLQAEAE